MKYIEIYEMKNHSALFLWHFQLNQKLANTKDIPFQILDSNNIEKSVIILCRCNYRDELNTISMSYREISIYLHQINQKSMITSKYWFTNNLWFLDLSIFNNVVTMNNYNISLKFRFDISSFKVSLLQLHKISSKMIRATDWNIDKCTSEFRVAIDGSKYSCMRNKLCDIF